MKKQAGKSDEADFPAMQDMNEHKKRARRGAGLFVEVCRILAKYRSLHALRLVEMTIKDFAFVENDN